MAFFSLSLLYAVAACLLIAFEIRRSGRLKADPLGIFMLIVALQCVLPGVLTFGLLPYSDREVPTGMSAFDTIYRFMDIPSAFLVLALTIWFIVFAYVGVLATHAFLSSRFGDATQTVPRVVHVSTRGLVGVLIIGLIFTAFAFHAMGDTPLERYANMILLRSRAPGIEPTALTANGFALLQTWAWLCIVALFAIGEQRGRTMTWYACLAMLIVFAVLGVSRRSMFLPIVFAYLILVMTDGKWRAARLLAVAVVIIPVVVYGKEYFALLSYGGETENLAQSYSSTVTAALRASSDVGISMTESIGTISMIDLPPRFGVDHLLSVAQRFPEGVLGLDVQFPERIVRISTRTFADDWTVDIPPGLMGQMWLDFRIFGPVIWGLAFGLQIGILQYLHSRVVRSRQSSAVLFMLVFVAALPVNSGSFDFSFSVDIILFLFVLFLCVRFKPASDKTLSSSKT